MIGGDMLLFALFFVTYLYYRGLSEALYLRAQAELNQQIGLLNTLVLLTSSWLVASAISRVRAGRVDTAGGLLVGAFALGVTFIALKTIEYREKTAAGITIETNEFFAFYFMLTGIHLLHVLVGLGVLSFLLIQCRKAPITPVTIAHFESGASYWHLVDLLWVVLFPLLYLIG